LATQVYHSIPMQKYTFTLTILTLFISSALAFSAPDTPDTRRHEAERYLQATPPKALFEDMADKMAANLPPEQRDQFKKLMTSQLDIAALTKAMIDSMVKHFTTEELKALADFYGSPVGKSAMQKFGAYMADIMPAMEAEIMKAQAKMNQSLPNQTPK
jgi:hypothetical protein